MDESINSIGEVISTFKGPVAVYSIIGIILLIILGFICRKSSKKNKELSKKEMTYYLDNAFNWAQPKQGPSGNISLNGTIITYSRGSRRMDFDICYLEKNTMLAPFMVENWFAGRNYSQREESVILDDIKNYLEENRYVKSATVISDEEYCSMYGMSAEEQEE